MNDILLQWDKMQKTEVEKATNSRQKVQSSSKKANAPFIEEAFSKKDQTGAPNSNSTGKKPVEFDMDAWLDKYGTQDKDNAELLQAKRKNEANKNYLINMKPDATIDLHGLHQDEAEYKLKTLVSECKRRGLKKILIIHGKGIHSKDGEPVLGKVVKNFIEKDKRCGMSGHPAAKDGASGATWVILK